MKVFKNYLFNAAYQILIIILPLITIPYITRIFTPQQIGINAYTFSVAQYFVLFAGLGVGIYGNRTLAYIKKDEKKRIEAFWSIFFAVLSSSIIACLIYYGYVLFVVKNYVDIYIIQSLYIFSVAIDISWLFMAMEDFKKVVVRNTIIKLVGVGLIFSFVKSEKDLSLYILVLALTNFIGTASMWFYLRQYIKGFKFNIAAIKGHFIPLISIYIPQVAIQVYAIMDKTMIGILSNEAEVGYYDMSQKIVKIILALVTSLGVVMIPHISTLIAEKKHDEVEENIGNTFRYMSYFSFPMAFGLSVISQGLAIWFFGKEYTHTGVLMGFSSFIIVAITWSNITGMQLLMPMMKEKEFTISVISGAVINVLINIILIPLMGSLGAIIATIVAEFTVTIVQIYLVKKYVNVIPHIKNTWKNFVSSIVMFIVVYFTTYNMSSTFYTTFIQVILGGIIYLLMMYILKSDIQGEIFNNIINIATKNTYFKRVRKGI